MDRMTWIHADDELHELRELTEIGEADMEIDISPDAELIDNTWSITVPERVWEEEPIRMGHYVYCPGTEWGGPVTMIKHVTSRKAVTVQGPTWRGMLFQRRIYPPAGQGYLVYNDDAGYICGDIIGQSYGSIFVFDGTETGVTISAQFRYQSFAQGIQAVLAEHDMRIAIEFDNLRPAAVVGTKTVGQLGDVEISQDYGVNFTSVIGNTELANHCLALGPGELAERTVLEVYRVGDTYYTTRPVTLPVEDIRTVLLDYGSAESNDELLKSAIERLQSSGPKQSITINEITLGVEAQLGDRLTVRDRLTGLIAESEVTKKILTIKEGITAIDMEVGILTIKEGA